MKELLKKIGVDHELARQLWDTGNHDARTLAMKIADPAAATLADLDRWVAATRVKMCAN
jgi:3-methyladenine DNA glycosylase AlkD